MGTFQTPISNEVTIKIPVNFEVQRFLYILVLSCVFLHLRRNFLNIWHDLVINTAGTTTLPNIISSFFHFYFFFSYFFSYRCGLILIFLVPKVRRVLLVCIFFSVSFILLTNTFVFCMHFQWFIFSYFRG